MYIAIKSEMDSRPVVYPLMRALRPYGSILVVSSNKQLLRLIEDEAFSTFRDITILVDEDGATDDIYQKFGVVRGDYDYVILDNVGLLDYDICLIPIGFKVSSEFEEDLQIMEGSEDAAKMIYLCFCGESEREKKKKEAEQAVVKRGKNSKVLETDMDYDPTKKFRDRVEMEDKTASVRRFKVTFPQFKSIEQLEGEHRFFEPDSTLTNVFYEMFKDELGISINQFRKEMRNKDESSGYIK